MVDPNQSHDEPTKSEEPGIPARLRKFKMWGNFPIFFTVQVDQNGNPNFKDPDVPKREKCMVERLCGVCGEPLNGDIVCIEQEWNGESLTSDTLRFVEAAMHEECAVYASRVCPFLKRPGARVAEDEKRDIPVGEHLQSMNVTKERPERMGLFYLTDYGKPFKYKNDEFLSIKGSGLKGITWF